jgi:capsid protein
VIRSLRDLDDYEVAELVRKKTEACVTAIVFGDDESQQGIAPTVVDADGNRVEQFEPGLIAYARGGKDIRFNQPVRHRRLWRIQAGQPAHDLGRVPGAL